MPEVMLFTRCLGFTDARAISSQILNPETGNAQLIGCSNLTITDDGCLQTVPKLLPYHTHSSPIKTLSAGSRFFFSDDLDTYEMVAGLPVNRFPLISGPMVQTPLDVRVSTGAAVYKSVNPATAMQAATVGTNPGPATSVTYQGMPVFSGAFQYNSRLFSYTGKFLQYSAAYSYDLWDIGNGFIPHQSTIMQGGAIPGVVLLTHADGVTAYIGGDPLDQNTIKKFYPCSPVANTLYSGFISKAVGHGHVFLCDDGIYMVSQDGSINRITGNDFNYASSINASYTCAAVYDGRYMAYGDSLCVECGLNQKASDGAKYFPVMFRDSGISAAAVMNGSLYLAQGSSIVTPDTGDTTDSDLVSSFTLPYSTLGNPGQKMFDSLYFTGRIDGDMSITLMDQLNTDEPERWTLPVSSVGQVQNYRIRLPKGRVGSKVSFRFDASGPFRVEEIRAVYGAGQRR